MAAEEEEKKAPTQEGETTPGSENAGRIDENAAVDDAKEPVDDADKVESEAAAKVEDGAEEWKRRYQLMAADFDNFRKRTARDREELVKFAASETVKDMLTTADNLALALDKAVDKEDPFVKGVQLAYDGFLKALKEHGAEPFASLGETPDPHRHEAIATLPSDTVEEGKICNEIKKGWLLNGKLLRAAQVVVSAGKANG